MYGNKIQTGGALWPHAARLAPRQLAAISARRLHQALGPYPEVLRSILEWPTDIGRQSQ